MWPDFNGTTPGEVTAGLDPRRGEPELLSFTKEYASDIKWRSNS